MEYSYLYLLFLYHFNYTRDYYECHDVLEELWFETQRDRFYQGLLQVAVGLYHHRWKNPAGAILLFEGAVDKLQPYPDIMRGIDVGQIRREAENYLEKLQISQQQKQALDFYNLTLEIVDPELKNMVVSIHEEVEGSKK